MDFGKTFSLILLAILPIADKGIAQLIEQPLLVQGRSTKQRLKADTLPIDLPIWDDFSTSRLVPDTSFWVTNNAVLINPGTGINPPSLNVATFDGWNAFGNLYSSEIEATGKTDSLLSRPINMGKVPSSLQNTVFLSFYYQKLGGGDIPNEGDSLVLQFKNEDGSWETVWPMPGEPVSTVSNFFTQKILQVSPEYLYDGFQFKFQSYGRQNGPFDTWNIDYIYLDKRRDINDVSYLDRAFTSIPTSVFHPYTSVPIEHFFLDPESYLNKPVVEFINLERQVQPVEYSAITFDKSSGSIVDTLILDSAFLALRFPLGQFSLKAGELEVQKLDNTSDSIVLETTFYMDSGDDHLIDSISSNGLDTTRYQNIDLRVNDTTSVVSVLSDYYAYDDGTAEFGAGINQLNGRLAYMFVTETPDFVTAIDINFLNIGRIVAGTPIELFVLDSLVDNVSIEKKTTATAQVLDQLDQFITYTLQEPIFVSDTFFIGYQQSADFFLPVGLDKNTHTEGRVFLNVTGTWQKDSLLSGSLMMRPRFGEEVVTGIKDIQPSDIHVYPNPTSGRLTISPNPDQVRIFDIRGVELTVEPVGNKLDLSHLPRSVYLLKIRSGSDWTTRRIFLQN